MRKHEEIFQEAPREHKRGASSFVDDSQHMHDFYVKFGHNVQKTREKANFTQEEFSKKASIDRSYLSEIETGRRRVSLFIAFKIASLLGTTLDDLLEIMD